MVNIFMEIQIDYFTWYVLCILIINNIVESTHLRCYTFIEFEFSEKLEIKNWKIRV